MTDRVIDFEEARARRMGPRLATTAELDGAELIVTFPRPLEQLRLTAEKARFWRDMLDNFLPALEAEQLKAE